MSTSCSGCRSRMSATTRNASEGGRRGESPSGVPGMGLQVAGGYLLLKYSLQ